MRGFLILFLLLCSTVSAQNLSADSLYQKAEKARKESHKLARLLADSSYQIALKEENIAIQIKALKLSGLSAFYLADYSSSANQLNRALRLAESVDSSQHIMKITNALGVVYKFLGDYEQSISYFTQSYEAAKAVGDTISLARAYNNLGVLSRLTGNYPESKHFVNLAIEIYRQLKDTISLGESMNNLALCCEAIDDFKKADSLFSLAIQYKSINGNTSSVAKSIYNQGLVKIDLNRTDEGLRKMKQALKIVKGSKEVFPIASYSISIAKQYILKNELSNARPYLDSVKAILSTHTLPEIETRYYDVESQYFETLGDYKTSNQFQKKYHQQTLKTFNENAEKAIGNLKLLQRIDQMEQQNEVFKQENEIQKLKLENRRIEQLVGAAVILILVLFSILLYFRFIREKRLKELVEKQEVQLRTEMERAEKANNYKTEFLANMSHEIRTPLAGIKGAIDIIRDEEISSTAKEMLHVLDSSTSTLLAIINDILDISRIEAGKVEVSRHAFNLSEGVAEVEHALVTKAKEKNINLIVEKSLSHPTFYGDKVRLKQVLYNLLGNAIKFTERGSVTLRVNDTSETSDDTLSQVYIEVQDTGIGIEKENLKRIFQPFDQETRDTFRKFGGTGLGLSISQKLVELMGGELLVESRVGEGSKFFFSLPLERAQSIESPSQPLAKPSQKGEETVLIVEDNKINQAVLKMSLHKMGYKTEIAEDGEKGVELYKNNPRSLIFMDIRMPKLDGISATLQIRKHEVSENLPKAYIVAFTANAMIGDKERYLQNGMNAFLAKPFSKEQLEKTLQKYKSQG